MKASMDLTREDGVGSKSTVGPFPDGVYFALGTMRAMTGPAICKVSVVGGMGCVR